MPEAQVHAVAPPPVVTAPGWRTPVAVVAFLGIAVAGEFYAKWWPYGEKLTRLLRTHAYPGKSILGAPSHAAPVSWNSAWQFTVTYGKAVWLALAAALVIGAAVETILPRSSLNKVLGDGRSRRSSLVAGAMAVPCMMCTCCSAPVTRSLRRAGVRPPAALSYWLGNPLLNPAVIAFLCLVLPWQYAVTRVAIGALVVFGLPLAAGRLFAEPPLADPPLPGHSTIDLRPSPSLEANPGRFLWALGRLGIVLLPEYFLVVLAVGGLRGWLFPLSHSAAHWGLAAALLAAAAGTLLVIPTGAEIPVIVGLLAAGFSPVVAGTVLIALPALSLPSMVMVGRSLSWRLTGAAAGAVMASALAAGGLVALLGA